MADTTQQAIQLAGAMVGGAADTAAAKIAILGDPDD